MEYLLLIPLAVILLILISVVRALTDKKLPSQNDDYSKYSEEDLQCAEKLSKMISCKTLALETGGEQAEFYRYRKLLEELFPVFFEEAEEIEIASSYLWKIGGSSKGTPSLILAHSDVVEAGGEWNTPPFEGVIKDGFVFGRGALDNKGMLCCVLAALEKRLAEGFVPENDLWIMSTQNEETTATGALFCLKYFEENNISFKSILDEGGAVTCGVMPGITNDIALLGLCEKSYIDLLFTAKGPGGHSSSPSKDNPLARLSAFANYIETHAIYKPKILPTLRNLFRDLVPYMPFGYRLLLGNFWLYGWLLKLVLPKISPDIGAMMKTTIVFTRCEGSEAPNVIPTSASFTANVRNLPGESSDEVIAGLKRLAEKYSLETEVIDFKPASSETAFDLPGLKALRGIVAEIFPGALTAPYMSVGATDCCRLDSLSDSIVRFSPIRATGEEINTMHANNERVGIAQLGRAREFFYRYLSLT